jgi:hypothetical protein
MAGGDVRRTRVRDDFPRGLAGDQHGSALTKPPPYLVFYGSLLAVWDPFIIGPPLCLQGIWP